MPRVRFVLVLLLLGLAAAAPRAAARQAPSRADDLEVRTQIDQARRVLDRFAATIQPEARTESVATLQRTAGRLVASYRPPSVTATSLAADLLKQAKVFESGLTDATSDVRQAWTEVVPWLAELAWSYRIDWRTDPSGWVPRRVTDQELQLAAASLAAAAGDMASMLGVVLKRDTVMDSVEKARTVKQLDELAHASTDLRKAVARREDVSTLLNRAAKTVAGLRPFVSSYPGCQQANGQWENIQRTLETISAAYGS